MLKVTRHGQQRHAQQQGEAAAVSDDHDRPATGSIDPHSSEQPDQQERHGLDGGQVTHLSRVGVQSEHTGERQRQHGDLRSEQRDHLANPQHAEVAMSPERAWLPALTLIFGR